MNKFSVLFFITILFFACVIEEKVPEFSASSIHLNRVPLFVGRENPDVLQVKISVPDTGKIYQLTTTILYFTENSSPSILESVKINHSKNGEEQFEPITDNGLQLKDNKAEIDATAEIGPGNHTLSFGFQVKDDAILTESFSIQHVELQFEDGSVLNLEPESEFAYRPANVVRAAGQDNCDTYRIPGMVTTNEGTLIAVYDNRYNNSKDLQEDIDVGMSRSTDGGQTWEPMRVIMDMREWGGNPECLNGIGDPAVLYDHTTGTIWVAALWISGFSEKDMLWWASKPGMKPTETGQFVLVKSTDDGLTWSDPINITEQIKDPAWQLLFQGPGRGITLNDGTLVFPAQFKADIGQKALDGGQYTAHSTIVYSKDGGETWQIGTGAKPNTTEAQVVQLADGSLMLNMRDDLNRRVKDETNGRAVAVTSDLGKTWTIHPSSNSALPEPNCMASLIAADVELNGEKQQILFFSNPNDKEARINMTIKTSFDGGHTWPETNQVLLNENPGFGYSCMTMVDENTVGILYEGAKELYFQKVPVDELLGNVMN
ncbi:sialidase-1 [Tangfeifania diversioriginum]|uniref:exo-alpha-sialidase n=1 Tax=Tangfeifania diversioriginum TaxID=1168035 RepID=A0A1M6IF51_9BACT|nr:sialidase family protein [Tangfeifania diversioriginum]SHJ33087.1 sialidase-1 [Tangfeifania diversioriginum]